MKPGNKYGTPFTVDTSRGSAPSHPGSTVVISEAEYFEPDILAESKRVERSAQHQAWVQRVHEMERELASAPWFAWQHHGSLLNRIRVCVDEDELKALCKQERKRRLPQVRGGLVVASLR
jgi:hypothetical protein